MKEYNGQIFYTQTEAAELFKVARSTVWHKVKSGGIPAVDVLGVKMISKDFVDKVLSANFELANGQFFKGWKGKRERVTATSELFKGRAERKAAKAQSKNVPQK